MARFIRGRRGDLIKILWWDGQGLCLFCKRLERGTAFHAAGGDRLAGACAELEAGGGVLKHCRKVR
jgi:IS66 Orf2 like protein